MTYRFSANTGFLWKERPFLERIARAGACGFDAVEFHDEAQREGLDDVRAALRDAGLPVIGINTAMGETAGCAAIPPARRRGRARISRPRSTPPVRSAPAPSISWRASSTPFRTSTRPRRSRPMWRR